MPSIDGWWDSQVRGRAEDVLELVLNAIAEDYESVGDILQSINVWDKDIYTVNDWPALRAIPVSRREVIQALAVLIGHGYARAYRLDTSGARAEPVEFAEGEAGRLWFYATPAGVEAAGCLAIGPRESE